MTGIEMAGITDEQVDRAYEIMSEELNHWQIVGPLEERRGKHLPPREFWNAVRTTAINETHDPIIFHLTTKANAIACVQWHGLKAVLAAVRRELAPSASETVGNDNA